MDWLYTGTFRFDHEQHGQYEDFGHRLLQTWTVSDAFEDDRFRHVIVAQFFSSVEAEEHAGFGIESISYAYEEWNSETATIYGSCTCLI